MTQNYSNIVEPDFDGCYKKLYEVYRDKYREAAKSGSDDSDFSTFTMTLVADEMLSMTLPQIFEAGEMGEGTPAAVASLDASWGAGEYKIAAYKGTSIFTVNGGANKNIAVSGDVTYLEDEGANGTLIFTGDGTVTYYSR